MENHSQESEGIDIKEVSDSFEKYSPPIRQDGKIVYARMTSPRVWDRQDPRAGILWEFSGSVSDIRNLDSVLNALDLNDSETKLLYPCCGQDMAPFHVLGEAAHYTDRNNLLIGILKSKLGVNARRIDNKDILAYAKKIEPHVLYLKNPADMESLKIGKVPADYVVSDLSVVTEFSNKEIGKHVGTLILTVSQEDEIEDVTVGTQRGDILSATRQLSSERPKVFIFQR